MTSTSFRSWQLFAPPWQQGLDRVELVVSDGAEGIFRHVRRYSGRFPGCLGPAHSEQVLGCFIIACEQAHA